MPTDAPRSKRRRFGRIAWTAGVVLFIAVAAAVVLYLAWPRREFYYSDGVHVWRARPDLGLRTVLWDAGDPVTMLGELGEDYDPCPLPDGQDLYFTRGRAGGGADLYVAHRTLQGWSEPRPIKEINTARDEIGPALADGGTTLYFYSDRPGGEGGYDLWVSHHDQDHWTAPVNLGPRVNSPYNEYDPAVTPDGSQLLFSSNHPTAEDEQVPEGAWPATLREQRHLYDYDIYAVDLQVEAAKPRRLDKVSSPYNDGQPTISPDGRWLYFASDRPGGAGKYDIHRARIGTLPLTGLSDPENLGSSVNTPANELDPALALEGFGLYFSSDREHPDTYALYYSRSHEVFPLPPVVVRPNLGHIVGRFGWPLVALVLALAGLALLILALTKFHRRPGLLATALAISIILHLVALSLFSVWQLSLRIAELAASELRFEVTINIPSVSESQLSAELRTALLETARSDTAQFARTKSETLTAPPEPVLRKPEVALALAEPPPQEIELARPEERPEELTETLRQETMPPATPELLPAEPVQRVLPKEVRPAEQPEALPPRPLAMVPRAAILPVREAPPVPQPVRPTAAVEPVREVARPEVPEAAARPAPIPEFGIRNPEFTETPPVPELVPVEAKVEARPVRASTEPSAPPVSVRPLATARAETSASEPVAAVQAPQASAPASAAVPEETFVALAPAQPEAAAGRATIPAEVPMPRGMAVAAAETLDILPPAIGPDIAKEPHPSTTGRAQAEPQERALPVVRRPPGPVGPTASADVRGPEADAEMRLGAQAVGPTLVEGPPEPPALPPVRVLEGAEADLAARPPQAAMAVAQVPSELAARPPVSAPHEALAAARRPEAAPKEALAVPRAEALALATLPALPEAPARPPLAAHYGTPSDRTLLASTAAPAPTVGTPVVGEAVRVAMLPITVPTDVDVAAPPEPLPLSQMLSLRTRPDRQEAIEELGGTKETEEAVRRGLTWLARHQSGDGRWDIDGFMGNYEEKGQRCDGGGSRKDQDVGVTSLATLVFLGAGHTHIPAKDSGRPSPHAATVQKAIDWIVGGQKEDGDLRQGGQMYDQALAAMVLCEAYTMTGDERLAKPIKKAIDFILQAQVPDSGWRYEPRKDSDTSVVGWQIMALKSAEVAGFKVPPAAYRGAANWLDKVRRGERGGLYSYQPGRDESPAMTAEGLFCELYIDYQPATPRTRESVGYTMNYKPVWGRENNDLYFWYYATLALHQLGGPEWEEWNVQMRKTLVEAQRKDGPSIGSWDPKTRWGSYGGRVYSTALAALTLEIYYRFLPFYDLRLEVSHTSDGPAK